MNVYDKILEDAQYAVDDGERDLEKAFTESFDENVEGDYLWELIRDVFTAEEVMHLMHDAACDPWAMLWERACNEVMGELKDYADDHVWTVYYCDGPKEGDWYNYDEVYKEDEFKEMVDELVGDGYLLISLYDKEAYLEEVEEEEGE